VVFKKYGVFDKFCGVVRAKSVRQAHVWLVVMMPIFDLVVVWYGALCE
jgi:hypothetical protein